MSGRMTNAEASAARAKQAKEGTPEQIKQAVAKIKAVFAENRRVEAAKRAKTRQQNQSTPFTIVDLETGEIVSSGRVPGKAVQRQKYAQKPGRVVIEGQFSALKHRFDLETGEMVEREPEIAPDQVNSECAKRIRRKYSDHDQINAALEGGKAAKEVADYVTAHRNAAKALKASDPIPADFRDDKHWPA